MWDTKTEKSGKVTRQPIGLVLTQADLVSEYQIQVALQEQVEYCHLRLGEILVLHGWLKQETADFFAEKWFKLLQKEQKYLLGYYLKEAGILTSQQIQAILDEQKCSGIKFGSIAVLRGWLKEKTLEFFIQYLAPKYVNTSVFAEPKKLNFKQYRDPWLSEGSGKEETFLLFDDEIDWLG